MTQSSEQSHVGQQAVQPQVNPRIEDLPPIPDHPHIRGRRRVLSSDEAVFLPVPHMQSAFQHQNGLPHAEGVVAYVTAIAPKPGHTYDPSQNPDDFSLASIIQRAQNSEVDMYHTFAIGDGRRLPAAYIAGRVLHDMFAGEQFSTPQVGAHGALVEIDRQRVRDPSVVIGLANITGLNPDPENCITYPLSDGNGFTLTAIAGNPDSKITSTIPIPEGQKASAILAARAQELLGWMIVGSGGVIYAGRTVATQEPVDGSALVINTYDSRHVGLIGLSEQLTTRILRDGKEPPLFTPLEEIVQPLPPTAQRQVPADTHSVFGAQVIDKEDKPVTETTATEENVESIVAEHPLEADEDDLLTSSRGIAFGGGNNVANAEVRTPTPEASDSRSGFLARLTSG